MDLTEILSVLDALPQEEVDRIKLDAATETRDMRWVPNEGPQMDAYASEADVLLYGGAAGGGKDLSLDTQIPTPFGWSTMQELGVGDQVFDDAGDICEVVAKSEVFNNSAYKVTFSDGSEIVAGGGHEWITQDITERGRELKCSDEWRAKRRDSRPKRGVGKRPDLALRNSLLNKPKNLPFDSVKTTQQIAESVFVGKRVNHSVRVAGAMVLPDSELLIDPYVLGAWLGDGNTHCARITGVDQEVFSYLRAAGHDIKVGNSKITFGVSNLQTKLRGIGVFKNKHIPIGYLRSSVRQRLSLLQGLMDTDGYCDLRGQCEFTTVKKVLSDGVTELLSSLGIKNTVIVGKATLNGKVISDKYRIKFLTELPAFRLSRKLIRQKRAGFRGTHDRRYILSVENVGVTKTQCIQVSSPRHTYLCGRQMVPTHNSQLLLGLATQQHTRSIIFRREASQADGLIAETKMLLGDCYNGQHLEFQWGKGKSLKFAGLKEEEDWRKHAGRERDLIGYDEAGEFLQSQVQSALGWNRGPLGQRCRVVLASNPPRDTTGLWMMEFFAPWLDVAFPDPAKPGELRWCYMDNDNKTVWVKDSTPIPQEGPIPYIYPHSRTFIPAKLKDNPYRNTPEYMAKLQSTPEPLRSQLINGDFLVGQVERAWQVCPTAWLKEAQARWKPSPPPGIPMCALGVDVAQGGDDNNVMSPRHDAWFAPLIVVPGEKTPLGTDQAGWIVAQRKDGATVVIDCGGGYGSVAYTTLKDNGLDVVAYKGQAKSIRKTKDNLLGFANKRSEIYWRFREALDPSQQGGSQVMLPPDPTLIADLAAPEYSTKGGKIQVTPKEDLLKKLGRSTDRGDAVVMSWSEGKHAVTEMQNWQDHVMGKNIARRPRVVLGHSQMKHYGTRH